MQVGRPGIGRQGGLNPEFVWIFRVSSLKPSSRRKTTNSKKSTLQQEFWLGACFDVFHGLNVPCLGYFEADFRWLNSNQVGER
jgi:hypothetical protein